VRALEISEQQFGALQHLEGTVKREQRLFAAEPAMGAEADAERVVAKSEVADRAESNHSIAQVHLLS
jgi:hypothetical protein